MPGSSGGDPGSDRLPDLTGDLGVGPAVGSPERAALVAELAARARQQEAVAELGRQALVDRDLAALLEAAVRAVARTLEVDYAEVLQRLPGQDALLLQAGVGWEAELVGRARLPAGRGSPAGLTLEWREPVVVEDLARERRCSVPELLSGHGVVAGLTVVIRGADAPYGVLGAEATRPHPFSPDDVLFLRAMANVLAEAINRTEAEGDLRAAHERERRLRQSLEAHSWRVVQAQETERRRIARELNEEIGQTLTGLKLTLEDPRPLTADAALSRMARAGELTAELLSRVHAMSLDLRPAMLDDLGLGPALVWLVERYRSQTGVDVALDCAGVGRRLSAEVETAGYRIVQEALTNVARHAAAKSAKVDCALTGSTLRIEVADQGAGFGVGAVPVGASSGLVAMEERARSLGGQLLLRSEPGRGTTIVAELPISGSRDVHRSGGEPDPYDTLTAREREVLALAADGRINAEIAAGLCISRRTVETHRARAMRKLGLHTHVELALYAVRRGILADRPTSPAADG